MKYTKVLVSSAILAAGLAVGVSSAAAEDVALTVDCDTPSDSFPYKWVAEGSSLVITPSECDFIVRYDEFGTELAPVAVGATETLAAGESARIYGVGGSAYVRTGIVFPEHTPSGQLLLTQDVVIRANPPMLAAGTPGGDNHLLGGDELCELDVDDEVAERPYGTVEIVISKAGKYTFRNITTDPVGGYELEVGGDENPIADPFLALYGAFDPSQIDEGVIGCSDDLDDRFDYDSVNADIAEVTGSGVFMEGHRPYFTARLEPGTYTLVFTMYDAVSAAKWASGDGGAWEPGRVSGTFEMWGPADSICLSADAACVEEQANANNPIEIPSTGSSSVTTLWVGLMAVLVGGGLVIFSRRSVRRA